MGQLQTKISTKIGRLYLVASKKGLQGIFWNKQEVPFESGDAGIKSHILQKAQQQIEEYLDGQRKSFDLPLDIIGSDFQKQVWQQLIKIPYGQTKSYKDIAKAVNNEKAYRAVGTANGRNPLSIVVPCHRVISSDGSLGGYGGGLNIKEKLLSIERNASI